MRFVSLILVLLLAACATAPSEPAADKDKKEDAPLVLVRGSYAALPGWGADDLSGWAAALARSCDKVAALKPDANFGPDPRFGTAAPWQEACRQIMETASASPPALRALIEKIFVPHEVRAGSDPEGLFTGYYEASLRGSKTRSEKYNVPLHARPSDLVMVNLGEFREELKGQRIAGRVKDGTLKPYETREEILAGKLPRGQERVLLWVDDPVEAFFVQVQGSGVVQMDDGSVMRIGYDGQNGHIYYAIGRELVKRGELSKDNVSMQAIRGWLAAHPAQAADLMNTNKSYVFFRTLTGEGPIGGQNVALTPGRSLAIDRSLLPYGMPVWLDAAAPGDQGPRLRRLMITQDTGGAIRGPVRGDYFWGFGPEAEHHAGLMKSKGRYWVLIPSAVTP